MKFVYDLLVLENARIRLVISCPEAVKKISKSWRHFFHVVAGGPSPLPSRTEAEDAQLSSPYSWYHVKITLSEPAIERTLNDALLTDVIEQTQLSRISPIPGYVTAIPQPWELAETVYCKGLDTNCGLG